MGREYPHRPAFKCYENTGDMFYDTCITAGFGGDLWGCLDKKERQVLELCESGRHVDGA